MMRKVIAVLLSLGLLVGLISVVNAQGDSEGQTSTSILVQNLSTSEATVQVDFYNTSGTKTGTQEKTGTEKLGGEKSTTFDQRYDSGDPGTDPFQGAAIISSDQPIGAVVQMVRSGGSGGVGSFEAYNGLATASDSVKAPLLLRGISSAGKTWNTTMVIQNTSLDSSAYVTVTFTPDPSVGLGTADTVNYTILAGGTQYIAQKDQTDLGTAFFGSASVESDQNVAVVVTSGTTDGATLIAYPTFTAGTVNVYLPGVYKNIPSLGDNYFTSLTIVNMGGGSDPSPIVSVEYQATIGTATGAYSVTVDTVTTIDQRYDSGITSDTFFGAIKLTSMNGTPIAAMLNTRGDELSGASKYATTYMGFSAGVTTAYVPYLLKEIPSGGYTWSTSILLQNLDPDAGGLNVSITYNEDPAIGSHTYSSPQTDIATFDFVDLRYDTNLTQSTFYGGAKIESTNGRPFGVVVLVRGAAGTGDALSSYLGISQ